MASAHLRPAPWALSCPRLGLSLAQSHEWIVSCHAAQFTAMSRSRGQTQVVIREKLGRNWEGSPLASDLAVSNGAVIADA